jgi:protein-tyrosine phosphatase
MFIWNDWIQQERERIMAMTKVFERLYVGDADDADRLAVTNPDGITAVVNLNTEPNQHWRDGITYVFFPVDEYERISSRRFEGLMLTIGQLIRAGTVLVHCGAGSSRSPVVVAVYMHLIGFKNFDDALSQLRGLRPVVAPSKLIIETAKVYVEGLI